MSPEPLLLVLYAAVFVSILLLVEGFYYLVVDNRVGTQQRNINRRMQWLADGVDRSVVMSRLRRKPFTEAEGLSARLVKLTTVQRVDKLLGRADLRISGPRFLAYCLAAFVALLLFLVVVHVSGLIAICIGAALGLGLPLFVVARKAGRRLERMEDQLPDALDMIVRSLRAGHPIATAINLVARELPDPLGSEFGLVADEMAFGLDLRSALENLGARNEMQDLRFMVMTIKMQALTGGNLGEVLGTLARLIRERHRLHLKVLALSSEGRFSVKILAGLPFFFFALISVLSPKYYANALTDPTLTRVFAIGLAMIVVGILLMRRIVNFRV
jgi:tight adherence protein B